MEKQRHPTRTSARRQDAGERAAKDVDADAHQRASSGQGSKRSLYHGVEWDPHISKWRSRITIYGRKLSLGSFASELDAAMAYNEALLLRGGSAPRYNRGLGDVDLDVCPPAYTGPQLIKRATRHKLLSYIGSKGTWAPGPKEDADPEVVELQAGQQDEQQEQQQLPIKQQPASSTGTTQTASHSAEETYVQSQPHGGSLADAWSNHLQQHGRKRSLGSASELHSRGFAKRQSLRQGQGCFASADSELQAMEPAAAAAAAAAAMASAGLGMLPGDLELRLGAGAMAQRQAAAAAAAAAMMAAGAGDMAGLAGLVGMGMGMGWERMAALAAMRAASAMPGAWPEQACMPLEQQQGSGTSADGGSDNCGLPPAPRNSKHRRQASVGGCSDAPAEQEQQEQQEQPQEQDKPEQQPEQDLSPIEKLKLLQEREREEARMRRLQRGQRKKAPPPPQQQQPGSSRGDGPGDEREPWQQQQSAAAAAAAAARMSLALNMKAAAMQRAMLLAEIQAMGEQRGQEQPGAAWPDIGELSAAAAAAAAAALAAGAGQDEARCCAAAAATAAAQEMRAARAGPHAAVGLDGGAEHRLHLAHRQSQQHSLQHEAGSTGSPDTLNLLADVAPPGAAGSVMPCLEATAHSFAASLGRPASAAGVPAPGNMSLQHAHTTAAPWLDAPSNRTMPADIAPSSTAAAAAAATAAADCTAAFSPAAGSFLSSSSTPLLAALGAATCHALPRSPRSPLHLHAACAALEAAEQLSGHRDASCETAFDASSFFRQDGPEESTRHYGQEASQVVQQVLEQTGVSDLLARLSVSDLQQMCPETAGALQERMTSGRPELLEQVLQVLGVAS